MFSIVVGMSANGGIGVDNSNTQGLPWKCPIDMKFFRNLTKHNHNKIKQINAVIMGRNTYQTLNNKLLPGRVNVVVSSVLWNLHKGKSDYMYSTESNVLVVDEKFIVCKTLDNAILYCNKQDFDNMYVIGGGQLYKEALYHKELDVIYVSFVPDCCMVHVPTIFFPLTVSELEERFPNKEIFMQDTVEKDGDYQVFTYKSNFK